MFQDDAPSVYGSLQMPLPQPKPQGGMFGGGGKFGLKQALAFGLAGFMARRNPALLQGLMGAVMQKQHEQSQESQYQRERSDNMADWQAKEQFKIDHPEARAPHYFESNSGDQYTIGPDGKPQEVFHDPFRYKMVPNGMGGVIPVDIEALMRGGGGVQKPVGRLTPIEEGGPTLGGSGGFL